MTSELTIEKRLRDIIILAMQQIQHDSELLYQEYETTRSKTMAEKAWEDFLVEEKYKLHMATQTSEYRVIEE